MGERSLGRNCDEDTETSFGAEDCLQPVGPRLENSSQTFCFSTILTPSTFQESLSPDSTNIHQAFGGDVFPQSCQKRADPGKASEAGNPFLSLNLHNRSSKAGLALGPFSRRLQTVFVHKDGVTPVDFVEGWRDNRGICRPRTQETA